LNGIAGGCGRGWPKRLDYLGMRMGVLVLVEIREEEQIETGYKAE
jgi:hypothetical protein